MPLSKQAIDAARSPTRSIVRVHALRGPRELSSNLGSAPCLTEYRHQASNHTNQDGSESALGVLLNTLEAGPDEIEIVRAVASHDAEFPQLQN